MFVSWSLLSHSPNVSPHVFCWSLSFLISSPVSTRVLVEQNWAWLNYSNGFNGGTFHKGFLIPVWTGRFRGYGRLMQWDDVCREILEVVQDQLHSGHVPALCSGTPWASTSDAIWSLKKSWQSADPDLTEQVFEKEKAKQRWRGCFKILQNFSHTSPVFIFTLWGSEFLPKYQRWLMLAEKCLYLINQKQEFDF